MAASQEEYDVLVIGGGSGGLAFAKRAGSYGASVAVFENKRLGGTCVNVGCVPKKMMFNTAHVAETLRDAKSYGFDVQENVAFDYKILKAKRDAHIKKLNGIYARNLEKVAVTVIRSTVKFVDQNTLQTEDGKLYKAKKIVIACGGSPKIADIPGKEFIKTSDDFFNELEELPKKAAVIGAGYIAVELGHVMQSLGVDVSLLFRKRSLLRTFDEDIQMRALKELEHAGVTLCPRTTVEKIEKADDGTFKLTFEDKTHLDGFDYVLYAIGRYPVSKNLNVDKLDLKLNKRGYVKSDEWEQTNVEGIYALGDVNGKIELTPVAIRAGRKLADRLYGGKAEAKCDYVNVPSVVFLDPPIGTIGYTEKEADAKEEYKDQQISVYTSEFRNMYHTIPDAPVKTFMKIICIGENEKVVGLHMIGVGCDEILQGFGVAIKMGATKEDLDSVVAIHPTASEELVTMKQPKRAYVAGNGDYALHAEQDRSKFYS